MKSITDQKVSVLQAWDWWHSNELVELDLKHPKWSLWVGWFVNESIKRVRKMPDLRWKLSKMSKMSGYLERLPLRIWVGFFHKKGEIPPPLHGQVQKIEELLIKIMNKSELKDRKGQFRRKTLYNCFATKSILSTDWREPFEDRATKRVLRFGPSMGARYRGLLPHYFPLGTTMYLKEKKVAW